MLHWWRIKSIHYHMKQAVQRFICSSIRAMSLRHQSDNSGSQSKNTVSTMWKLKQLKLLRGRAIFRLPRLPLQLTDIGLSSIRIFSMLCSQKQTKLNNKLQKKIFLIANKL